MREILLGAGMLAFAGVAMAQMADRMTTNPPVNPTLANATVAPPASRPTGNRSVQIGRDPRGHYQTDVRIDGQRIGVMVDTGASVVALNESSAARIGVRPSRADYTARVSTANGTVNGARARIAKVELEGIVVRDVDALVLPDEALSENLLGLSFLSRLKRFAFADGNLVLEQ